MCTAIEDFAYERTKKDFRLFEMIAVLEKIIIELNGEQCHDWTVDC